MSLATRRESAARKARQRRRWRKPPLSVKQILAWADEHQELTGRWPRKDSGRVPRTLEETWQRVDMALRAGARGLPGGDSLARVLARYRGVRNRKGLPSYSIEQILAWADRYHRRHGQWPTPRSGPIEGAPGETWMAVAMALGKGQRGLPGGSSLIQLLAEHRGRRNRARLPRFTTAKVVRWADAHHRRTGEWPDGTAGAIPEAPGETWGKVRLALFSGKRGLKRSSLVRLLAEYRGVRNLQDLPDFSVKQILAWADAFYARHAAWPHKTSGAIDGAPGESWNAVSLALSRGTRGLRGGSSLARLLAERRGVRNHGDLPEFSTARILSWADAHQRRTGMWPNDHSGAITEAPDETWAIVDRALRNGVRGLRGGSSLARLLKQKRGVKPKHRRLPPLSIDAILQWADAHYKRTLHWPKQTSGKVREAPDESWMKIDDALRHGKRGLPAGLSLGKLWATYRGVRNRPSVPRLTKRQIVTWAEAWRRRHGDWPMVRSGNIPEAPGDNWVNIDNALRLGLRSLPGGSSLKRLLARLQ